MLLAYAPSFVLENASLVATTSVVGAGALMLLMARSSQNDNLKRDGKEFNSTLTGSARILANKDMTLSKDAVAARVDQYEKLYGGARKNVGQISTEESIKKRQEEYQVMVDSFYDLVTDFYEYGWGQSFHFAQRYIGETFEESIKRSEHYLASRLQLSKGKRALDMGCGIGGPMREIARFSGAKIDGITINEYQVKVGNRYNEQKNLTEIAKITQGDFMNLPWEDETFDGVYCIESTCHAPDKVACFKEAFRVLKPGGLMTGYEWVMCGEYDPKNKRHVELREGIEVGNGLPTIVEAHEIKEALEKAGFEVLENRNVNACHKDALNVPWYATLQGSFTLRGFRMTKLGRYFTHGLVATLEFLGIAPKGSTRVSQTLNDTADDIVGAGELGLFTPGEFFLARKPLK